MKKIILALALMSPLAAFAQSQESNEYYNKGVELYNAEQYEEAIGYLKKSDSLEKKELAPTSPLYNRSTQVIASAYSNIAIDLFNSGNFQDAIKAGATALEAQKKATGDNHPDYAQVLDYMATFNYYSGNLNDAIRFNKQAIDTWKATLGENDPNYAQSLGNLALCYFDSGNFNEALRIGTTAAEIKKQVLGENHPDYAQALSTLAEFNTQAGKYAEALRLGTSALEIKKAALGENYPDYALDLNNLARYNSNMGNYSEAIALSKTAADILRKTPSVKASDYAMALNNLASFNAAMGDYAEAIRLGTTASESIKQIFGNKHPDYAASIDNLASYNHQAGNTSEAIKLGTQAMEIKKQTLGTNHRDYATSLYNLASFHAANADYNEAIKLQNAAVEIRRNTLGPNHPEYAQSLASLASFYSAIGNYNEAIELGKTALEIRKNSLGEQHPDYAKSLLSLADFYGKSGNKDEAAKLATIAMDIDRNTLGDNHPAYATSLSNLAVYYSDLGNFKEAIRLESIAMEIDRYNYGENHPNYATSLSNLAVYYSNDGNYTVAIRMETAATEIRQKTLGEDHPLYARSLNNLAAYNLYVGNYETASQQLQKRYQLTNSYILKNFSTMTGQERTNFWNIHSVFFGNTLPFAAFKHPNPTSNALAYDGQLFSKGLLLNAELEIQKLIEKSGDKNFAEKFNKIRSDRATLDHLYQITPEKRQMNADSLASVIEKEEKQLVESSKELGDYTRDLAINWHDVQNKLTDTDIAIEFADFMDKDKHTYVALVLTKAMTAPEIVEVSIGKIDSTTYFTTSDLYNSIWQPLHKYLQGFRNVYFAPCGKFHSIAIEYLPDETGEIFAKKFNAYRLTSTRELALAKTVNPEKKASVYGGIIYNFAKGDWQDLKDSKDEIVAEFRDIPDFEDGETQRAGIGFLKGAKIEAEQVIDILRDGEYLVAEGSDVNATEESFKKLSGTGVKILHVATHGFYEPEGKKKSFSDYLTVGNKNNKEDLSLSRSGLFLAGAASALDPVKRKDIPEGVEDGILTAKEISRLDFQGLDLVVLSACQTGLGEVTGEGVFGLQRGFKKAGAKTIVMSLWKVDDAATKDLMTEFYKNLMGGMSKREAFVKSQENLRSKYKDPKKWAAFIMVDGQ